jgi:hypothetical protein
MRSRRLFAALALLVLGFGTGCGNDRIDSRIVGAWEPAIDMKMAEMSARVAKSTGTSESAEALASRVQMASGGEQGPRLIYSPDGTFVMEGPILGHFFHVEFLWALVEDSGDHVTIEVVDHRPGHKGETDRRTFVFEEPDLIRGAGGLMDGTRFRRVK